MTGPLDRFSADTRAWFTGALGTPTRAQQLAWESIASGQHTLVIAPTGSGKTLAAFLWALDRLLHTPRPADRGHRTRVLYISPLKALGVDVERNLRVPLSGITAAAADLGEETTDLRVGVRSGDTPAGDRRRLATDPPDILITTPESLYLLLTSSAAEALRGIDTVIVDEVHAVAGTKRGAHLAVSLERLDDLLAAPAQRIGLSATVEPAEEVARFLGGAAPVRIVDPGSDKRWDLTVTIPVPDLADLSRGATEETDPARARSLWPHIEERVLDLVLAHDTTLVFVNSRWVAEKVTVAVNELLAERLRAAGELADDADPPVLARSHHGSVSKEQRARVEADLKEGRLRCVVATSSLELGIDMGAIDLVVQIGAPISVASGLQRVGRAGHRVGDVSEGIILPTHQADLVHATVVVDRMRRGLLEPLHVIANPLDILAQQTVAAASRGPLEVERWWITLRRSAPFSSLPRSAYEATLDLLAGRYPSDEFAELRPRLVWDRRAGTLAARPGAQRLAVTSGGTIPDRGLYPVVLVGAAAERGPRRVGELDEEMVYESRVGDIIALGASSWRIEQITPQQVQVSPAPGRAGRLPFWHGEADGRPAPLGEAMGAFVRGLEEERTAGGEAAVREDLAQRGLDPWAVDGLVGYLADQRRATGMVPDDRRLVVEWFRDELGDWRVVLHSPYGKPVNGPWALAVAHRIRRMRGIDPQVMGSDDGIVVRLAASDGLAPDPAMFAFDPHELERIVTTEARQTSLFAARFRECAARALLLPRREPGRRSPLWQQRHRSAQLLHVAAAHPDFPIIVEALREVLQDADDLPALMALQERIGRGEVELIGCATPTSSPFASSLLLGFMMTFIYDADIPQAERRAATLGLDPGLLDDLLGRGDLADLLDIDVMARVEAELQHTAQDRRLHGVEGAADLLRLLGPLSTDELAARLDPADEAPGAARALVVAGRAIEIRIAGEPRLAAVEDAGRLRDGMGIRLPDGVPEVFTAPADDPLGDLVARWARSHGPFTAGQVGAAYGLGRAVTARVLDRLAEADRVVRGHFHPDLATPQYVDPEVLGRVRRRSLAALRAAVRPVAPALYGAFLTGWQHVGPGRRLEGADGLVAVVDQLAGVRLPASAVETLVLPARLDNAGPDLLDGLIASGEIVWTGEGGTGADGWVSLHPGDAAALTLPTSDELAERAAALEDPAAGQVLAFLTRHGGAFRADEIAASVEVGAVTEALGTLARAGLVTSDTYASVRALLADGTATLRSPPAARPRTRHRRLGMRAGLRLPPPAPTLPGRWSALRPGEIEPTVRSAERAQVLMDRYGVVTRGAVEAEGLPGGFAAQYRVLSELEERGLCRRGYFVDGLGAAQFAEPATVDRLRSAQAPGAVLLAAADPANPYGAALEWPGEAGGQDGGARPSRRAGAVVVLADGAPILWLERGGHTALAFTEAADDLHEAAECLIDAVGAGRLGALSVERVNGFPVIGHERIAAAVREALVASGFYLAPRAVRARRR